MPLMVYVKRTSSSFRCEMYVSIYIIRRSTNGDIDLSHYYMLVYLFIIYISIANRGKNLRLWRAFRVGSGPVQLNIHT